MRNEDKEMLCYYTLNGDKKSNNRYKRHVVEKEDATRFTEELDSYDKTGAPRLITVAPRKFVAAHVIIKVQTEENGRVSL